MEISANPQWQQLAMYAAGGAILLAILFNIPFVGRVLRALFSLALLGLCLFLLLQQAPFDPTLGRIAAHIGLDSQTVSGGEVRIRMARDGHFWAQVSLNGYERRMFD
jgi:aspartyl protease family protein